MCPYANMNRPSDITIGDFWGWEKACPTMNKDDKGCSLVFVNTEKGETLLNSVSRKLQIMEIPIEKAMQPNLQHPTPENILRVQYESDYTGRGFKYVMYKYGEVGIKYHFLRIVRFAKRQIKRIFK